MKQSREVTAVVLAAGASSRMGSPKALLRFNGETFLDRVVRIHRAAGNRVVVVLGFDAVKIRESAHLEAVHVLINPDPSRGPLSSFLTAFEDFRESSAAILHPVDHPVVGSATAYQLQQAHLRNPAMILIPEFQGQKGHPVLFPAKMFADFPNIPLDAGARWLVRRNSPQVQRLRVTDPGILVNVDTIDAYTTLTGRPDLHDPLRLRQHRLE